MFLQQIWVFAEFQESARVYRRGSSALQEISERALWLGTLSPDGAKIRRSEAFVCKLRRGIKDGSSVN